ncbi:MAG TPA: alpha/beta fold hydrolase [Stellaceae bacterium]|nr:alpha/beta fold hydrolase [Stellaceae bacterium]
MAHGSEAALKAQPDELAARAAEEMLGPNPFVGLRLGDVLGAFDSIAQASVRQPRLVLALQAALAGELLAIAVGRSERAPPAGDRRFQDAEWRNDPRFKALLQAYLAWAARLDDYVGKLGLGRGATERARFAMSLLSDALAPSNALWTNPAALRRLGESGGASLLAGCRNLLGDLLANGGMPAQVDKRAFRPGENLALTPGAVVLRHDVLELIQYAPAGETVRPRPLLIVPPQINKFYIFDLAPGRSLIEYLTKNGFQVFVASWRNPAAAQRDWSMDTYVDALTAAIDAICDITGSADVNLAGACSGAMTLSALLGHLAAKGDRRVHSATMMVVLLDRSEDSQLGLFATPQTVAAAKQASAAAGVLSGSAMGRMFAWMRPNDLVWSYWVNNYLLGNDPPAFDILYWNNDTTRLPARFHGEILDLFTANLLRRPGGLEILGTPIDLAQVTCDKYVVAGTSDHITPWQGGWRAARLFGGRTDFVLAASGHIQSIVNPPGNPKARYFVNPDDAEDPERWRAAATATQGSWWDHWRDWLAARSGDPVAAPAALGNARHPPLAAAPGAYVLAP